MIIFNSNELSLLGRINEIKRNIFPDFELDTKMFPGNVGEVLVRKRIGRRLIEVTMTLKSDNLEDKADDLADALASDFPVPITFEDQPGFTYYGMVQSSINKEDLIKNIGRVTFVIACLDPYKYYYESIASTSTGSVDIYIENEPTLPVMDITINQAFSNLHISNGSKTLGIIWNFVIGDTINIDFEKEKIIINNELKMVALDLENPDYFYLEKGTNTITFSNNCDVNVVYRERRL